MGNKKIKIVNSRIGYDLAASDYDKKEKYLDSFEKNRVLPILGNMTDKKILDVGAGTGRLSIRLAKMGAKVIALDVSKEMLDKLKNKNHNIETVLGEAESLSFEADTFDIVVATFLIVHLKDPRVFFDEVYRVLKPGGLFLVTNINQKRPPEIKTKEGLIEIESYYHRPEKICQLVEELAFSIEKEVIVKENDVWVNQILLLEK